MIRELILGCGNNREKFVDTGDPEWHGLVTVDIDPAANPTVLHDLDEFPYPWPDEHFDEVWAREVVEHLGRQGDWRSFFQFWNEIHRITKPGGFVYISCPAWWSPWAWGDPGHTRIFSEHTAAFLDRSEYEKQVGTTSMTDYRHVYTGDFRLVGTRLANKEKGEHSSIFIFLRV
jgi:SAM-dependent methyltransferase